VDVHAPGVGADATESPAASTASTESRYPDAYSIAATKSVLTGAAFTISSEAGHPDAHSIATTESVLTHAHSTVSSETGHTDAYSAVSIESIHTHATTATTKSVLTGAHFTASTGKENEGILNFLVGGCPAPCVPYFSRRSDSETRKKNMRRESLS